MMGPAAGAQPYFTSGFSNDQANQQAAQSPQQQRMVSALMGQGIPGTDYSPVQNVGQGIARVAGQTMGPLEQQWAAQRRNVANTGNYSDSMGVSPMAGMMGKLGGIFGMGQ